MTRPLNVAGSKLTALEACKVAKGIATGLAELHARQMPHMDLNPNHVLLNELGDAVLTCPGVSAAVQQALNPSVTYAIAADTLYMSPEEISRDSEEIISDVQKSDIWALGCTLIHMLTGHPPLYDKQEVNILMTVSHVRSKIEILDCFSLLVENSRSQTPTLNKIKHAL